MPQWRTANDEGWTSLVRGKMLRRRESFFRNERTRIRDLALFLLLLLLAVSCSKKANRVATGQPIKPALQHAQLGESQSRDSGLTTENSEPANSTSNFIHLDEALAELRALEAPQGADKEIFNGLKSELERLLLARGADKFPATPPSGDPNSAVNLMVTASSLTWYEVRWGDWNNDGIVSAQDISPLAFYFGRRVDAGDPNYYKYAEYIDGNNDGTVNQGDVAAIAFHFGESTGGYNIYQADDASGTGSVKVASLTRPPVPDDPENPPLNKSLATLQYATSTGNVDPPGWVPTEGKFYQVIPFDTSTPPQESTEVKSEWVQLLNQPPVADLRANPASGNSPLFVRLDGTNSYDPDGSIVLYEFDFTTDGNYEVSNSSGKIEFSYIGGGTITVTLRVTDDRGAQDTASVQLVLNAQPIAVAAADPTSGDAPLPVRFSAAGSYDPDGSIVLYEWDFTSDGKYDWSDPSTGDTEYTYIRGGDYSATLRLTDNQGAKSTATVWIAVRTVPTDSPVAAAKADPTSGNPPLTVNLSATGSYDPDGSIVLYEWDFTSDGTYDVSNTTGKAEYTYSEARGETATLRITDNDGATDTDSILIGVFSDTFWAHTWGGSGDDSAKGIATDPSGGIYLAGYTEGAGVLLLKYDSSGNVLWARTWGGSSATAVACDASGNVYLAGGTGSFGAGGRDVLLLKYSSSGNLLWAKTWGGTDSDQIEGMAIDAQGDIYIAGYTYSFGAGRQDVLLLKYSSSGNLLWARTWQGSSSDLAIGIAVDSSSNVYVAGSTYIFGDGDVLLLKFDKNGTLLLAETWGTSGQQWGGRIASDDSGNVYITGEGEGLGGGNLDAFLLKYSSAGVLLWKRWWGGSLNEQPGDVAIGPDGKVYVLGTSDGFGPGWRNLLLLRYEPTGSLEWAKVWGNPRGWGDYHGITFDSGGNLYIAGAGNNTGAWSTVTGAQGSAGGYKNFPTGTTGSPTGAQGSPTGTETIPEGIIDTGGGQGDFLLLKNYE